MAKYHINAKGEPGLCRAKTACPFGDADEHYPTKAEAAVAYEKAMSSPKLLKGTSALKKQEADLMAHRTKLSERFSAAFITTRSRYGGTSFEMVMPRDEYDALREEIRISGEELRALRDRLNPSGELTPLEDPPSLMGAVAARDELAATALSGEVYGEAADWRRAVARYEAGDEIPEAGDNMLILPSDKILHTLQHSDNGFTSQSAMQAALVFPERDLHPALERLGVENVSVSSFDNNREWGLVYTVLTPSGDARSFAVYEHRNTDSLIINGETNWDREENSHGPYGKEHEERGKQDFFAEFAPGEHRQTAETLAFFLHEAQKGELPSDLELTDQVDRRDWHAIISESIPAYGEWAERNGYTPTKRWFEE